jgi:hypothetical protein
MNEVPDTSKHFDCRIQCLWVLSIPTIGNPRTLHFSLGSICLDPDNVSHIRHGLESGTEQPLSAHHSRGQARCWPAHLLSPLHSHACHGALESTWHKHTRNASAGKSYQSAFVCLWKNSGK